MSKVFKIESIDQIAETAQRFIDEIFPLSEQNLGLPIRCIAFYGSMGAGKTTFIKAVCKQLGITDEVSSPTFALVNEYLRPDHSSVFHFDFYRINKLEEVYDLGYDEYFYSGNWCLVEWPEKITELLPEEAIKVNIDVLEDQSRELRIDF